MTLVVPFDEIFANEVGLLSRNQSWERVELGKVCEVVNGFPFKSTLFTKETGFPVVRIRDLTTGGTETFFNGDVPPEAIINNGDLLIGMDGNFRCVEWHGGTAGLNQRVCKIIADERFLLSKFLLFGIDGYLKAIQDSTSSVTVGHLSSRDILRIPFPLPPLAEQRRIVAKLEALLSKVSTTQQRLSHLPTLLKRFRQSVLAAACSGRLTADWREENETNETGEVLLSRIKSARLKLARTAKETKQIESSFDSRVPEVTDDELGFDTFPETWKRCRIGAAGSVCNGSTPSRQQPSFWDGEIPWVSSGEVRNNLITTTRERITKAGFDGTSVRLLPRGTVLMAMIGEGKTRGQSAILEIDATINQNIAAVVISHGLVDSTFLWRWFQMRYEATREQGSGSGPQALNCERVRELPFVLPPLSEQHEIVRRVEKFFAFADQMEARLKHAKAHVDRLTQSLLAKAFRGELVPTEAELARREGRGYESASELLGRIHSLKPDEVSPRQKRAKARKP